jgi:hypothetical protein
MGEGTMRNAPSARAYPLLMESKAGSKFLFYRASLSENRFTLFRTHSRGEAGPVKTGPVTLCQARYRDGETPPIRVSLLYSHPLADTPGCRLPRRACGEEQDERSELGPMRPHVRHHPALYVSTGSRAARVSSSRPRGANRGAAVKRSRLPAFAASAKPRMAPMN